MAVYTNHCNSGDKKNRYGVRLTVTENSWDVTTNTSNITITFELGGAGALGLSTDYTGSRFYGFTNTGVIYVNGVEYARGSSKALVDNNTIVTLATWTGNVPHNNDGTLSLNCSGVFTGEYSLQADGGTAGGTVALTTIPRYFTTAPTLTLIDKSETSYTFKWSTSEPCDWVRWYFDDGTYWHDVNNKEATSGTFTVSHNDTLTNGQTTVSNIAITAGSTHSVKVECRRKDSHLWSFSLNSSNATYNYPYVTTVLYPQLNIGDTQSLILYNPLKRNVTVRMRLNNNTGTILATSATTNDTNVNLTPSASTLYSKIPSNRQGNCVYEVVCADPSNSSFTSVNYFNAVEDNCKPTISAQSITDTTNQSKTGSSSKLILNLSKPAVSITGNAKNSAYIKSIKVSNGSQVIIDKTFTSGTSNTGSGTAANVVTNDTFVITITDSRDYSTIVEAKPSCVTYIPLTLTAIFERNQPTDGKVKLEYKGDAFSGYFGGGTSGTQNTISVSWRWKLKSGADGTYSSWSALSPTFANNVYSQNVGILSGTFDYNKAYTFQIKAIDQVNTTGYVVTADVLKGKPVYWWNENSFNVLEQINLGETGAYNISADGSAYTGKAANVTEKKSLSSKSHSNYGTNNGYLPDMSFIAYWNGAYNSSNNSNLTYAHQGTIQCKPTVLYSNNTGSTGTITLSETASNFSFIDIVYRKDTDGMRYHGTRIYDPNGKVVNLFTVQPATSTTQQICYSNKTINGTSITALNDGYINALNSGKVSINQTAKELYIVKVVGWK